MLHKNKIVKIIRSIDKCSLKFASWIKNNVLLKILFPNKYIKSSCFTNTRNGAVNDDNIELNET